MCQERVDDFPEDPKNIVSVDLNGNPNGNLDGYPDGHLNENPNWNLNGNLQEPETEPSKELLNANLKGKFRW